MRACRDITLSIAFLVAILWAVASDGIAANADLPSWRDTTTRRSIERFVGDVTDPASKSFVPARDRIAVFDMDGTLITEYFIYAQFLFSAEVVLGAAQTDKGLAGSPFVKKLRAAVGPWKPGQSFSADAWSRLKDALTHDEANLVWRTALRAPSADALWSETRAWWNRDVHPLLKRRRSELAYQPVIELIRYLEARDFRVHFVTGSSLDFARPVLREILGTHPENIVGTLPKREWRDSDPSRVVRLPAVDHATDRDGKVLAIDQHIGLRPVITVGNSDGDMAMIDYTTSGPGKRLGVFIRHDDAEREFAYDRKSLTGRLDTALDRAPKEGWLIVSMKNDWATVFPRPSR